MAYEAKIKNMAVKMRKEGHSILAIARELNIAKSTVSLWVRDTPLPKELRKRLKDNSFKGCELGRSVMAARREIRWQELVKESEELLNRFVDISNRDFWQFTAAMLFWCEGGKRRLSGIEFANSDPEMAAVFVMALKLGFGVEMTRFRVQLHLHGYHDTDTQIDYWSKVTGIAKNRFHRPYIKPNTGKRKRSNYPGCASIRYSSADLAKKLDVIYHLFAKRYRGA